MAIINNSSKMIEERQYLREGDVELSERQFNLVIGGVLLWGFLLNFLMVTLFGHQITLWVESMGFLPFLIGYFALCIVGTVLIGKDSAALSFLGYNLIALPVGTKVTVISTENGWSKISSSAMLGNGYVKTKYLTSQKPGTTPTPKPGETAKPTATPFASYEAKVVNPNGNKVNLRKGAGMGYATINQLEPGTSLTVIGEKGDWFNVKYGSTTGYMKKEYVAKK